MDDIRLSTAEMATCDRRFASARYLAGARHIATGLAVVAVALAGVALGLTLGSRTVAEVGPFHAELSLAPGWDGQTSVVIPPLGSLHLDSHDGPAQLTVRLGALDQARTQQMINEPGGITRATQSVADDLVGGVIRVGLGSLGAAVLGAMVLAALVFRNVRKVAWAGGLALAVVAGSLGMAAATFRFSAVEEPRYEGLLVNAPALVGDVQRIADEWEQYADQLQRMVANVSTLYAAASALPVFEPDESQTRVLHVADLHLNPNAWPIMRTVVQEYNIDLIVDSGDIVDWGTEPESAYLDSIQLMEVPYVYVRGNHDSPLTQAAVAEQSNAIVLNNQVTVVQGLVIAGIADPRFTPDQQTVPHTGQEAGAVQRSVVDSGTALADTIRAYGEPVDIAVVHDPLAAERLEGVVPLVLAGHSHDRHVRPLTAIAEGAESSEPAPEGTLLMVQGSTGGAGLRGLQGEHPEPLALSVLYFDEEQEFVAYDDIAVGGHGLSEVTLQRHIVGSLPEPEPEPLDGTPAPTATPTPTPTPGE